MYIKYEFSGLKMIYTISYEKINTIIGINLQSTSDRDVS